MSLIQLAALIALGAMWGASYIFIRMAVEPMGPVFLVFVRVALSGLILIAYARLRGQRLNIRGHWRKFLLLGFLGSALPFTLIAWAELTVTASMAAILMSTTPLFTALVASFGLGEELTLAKLIGAVLGIIGVAITVGGGDMTPSAEVIAATLALLGATVSYAFGGVFAKRAFTGLDQMSMSSGQLIAAAFILAPVSLADLPLERTADGRSMGDAGFGRHLHRAGLSTLLLSHHQRRADQGANRDAADSRLRRHFSARYCWGEHQPGHHHRSAGRAGQRRTGDRAYLAEADAGNAKQVPPRLR